MTIVYCKEIVNDLIFFDKYIEINIQNINFFKRILVIRNEKKIFIFSAPKMVHFEKKWIGFLSLFIKLILGFTCLYLMFQRDSYQIFDRSPISAVTIKVKQSTFCSNTSFILKHYLKYDCSKLLYDVNDFIIPATENSAVSITTRIVEIEHILKYCNETMVTENSNITSSPKGIIYRGDSETRAILPPLYRNNKHDHEDIFKNEKLCWFRLPSTPPRFNYDALDYIIFIKHFVEFTQLKLIRDNLMTDSKPKDYLENCEYDPYTDPLCPKFRLLKILQMLHTSPHEYELIFFYGSLIEITISWKCNLDRNIKYCEPYYEFQRLDIQPYQKNPYEPGSHFLTSRHFFRSNSPELHRIHTHIYNLHIVVSVTGEARKFDLFQTTTSIGSFLGIFGTGALVCDFLAGFVRHLNQVKYDYLFQ